MRHMVDDALFDFGPQATEPTTESQPPPIAKWQADSLRKYFDDGGQTTMREQNEVVELVVGRGITSLEDLTLTEAYAVLRHMESTSAPRTQNAQPSSAWDNRDSNTWIDNL